MKILYVVFILLISVCLFAQNTGSITDLRDNITYKTVTIGNQVWLGENLKFDADKNDIGRSWCYEFDNKICSTYGRLYNYDAALKVCPEGWHLPSDQEWKELERYIGMRKCEIKKTGWRGKAEAKKIKSSDKWPDANNEKYNNTGFSALPAGFYFGEGGFQDINKWAYWWTSTKVENSIPLTRYINYKLNQIGSGKGDMTMGLSVRCVKDN